MQHSILALLFYKHEGVREVGNRPLQRSKTPAGRGVRTEVCFWGKAVIVLGNLTTVPGGKRLMVQRHVEASSLLTGESSQCLHPSAAINHAEAT